MREKAADTAAHVKMEHAPVKTVAVTAKVTQEAFQKQMNEMLKKELPRMDETIFQLQAPEAKEVYLAGDFNNWALDESSRMKLDNGTWKMKVNLASGKYRYRFVIDGNWTEDPVNPLKETNPFGSTDSLIEVKKGAK
jgi:1,4-alpha-glucan branching enzyme